MHRTLSTLLIAMAASLVLVLLLAGCGGGDPEDDQPTQPTPKVDCVANPALCK